jgi:hypothetical protein
MQGLMNPGPQQPAGQQPRAPMPQQGQPQGQPKGQPQAGGAFDQTREATPEEQETYNRFVSMTMNMLYDEKAFPQMVKMLEGGGDPVEGLSTTAVLVIARVALSAEQAGEPINGDILFNAGTEIINQLADVSDEAGLSDYANDSDMLEAAYYKALDKFRMLMESNGRIDQQAMGQDLQRLQGMSDSGDMERSLKSLAANDPRKRKRAPEQEMA